MFRVFGLFFAIAASVLLGACESDKPADKPDDSNRVSNIPWNRPESWEGQGPMGGMTPGTR